MHGCTTSKTSRSKFRTTDWSSLRDFRVPANRPSLSTRSSPKGSAATWRASRPMPDNSWARSTSPMWMSLRVSLRPSPSNRRSIPAIRVRRSAPRPNCTTTLNSSTPASDTPSRPYRDRRSSATPRTTWRSISSPCPKAAAWPSQRRCNCAKGRASSKS